MDKHQQQQRSQQQQQQLVDSFAPLGGTAPEEHGRGGGAEAAGGAAEMVDYMLGQQQQHHHQPPQSSSFDKLSFSDVLQFADFGPKLALNNQPGGAPSDRGHDVDDVDSDDDDSYFFRFQSLTSDLPATDVDVGHHAAEQEGGSKQTTTTVDGSAGGAGGVSESTTTLVQQQQQPDGVVGGGGQKGGGEQQGSKSGRRKRPRSTKTSEEVESQRMTHIAVERNRRRQMNDYLRVLRSLMPGSYVQRGDQASIIGGAIEFIRELEQLIQCLESQKRRRLYGDAPPARPVTESGSAPPSSMHEQPPPPPPPQQQQQEEAPLPFYPPMILPPAFPAASALTARDVGGGATTKTLQVPLDAGLGREEVAENKSCLADIEVRLLGEDAMIKVLSRRRPEQLIKTIAALEDMHMSILHTNITTIEQTVLYSFNVKIAGEPRFSADDIAGAVHQILSFIDVNYTL